MASQTAKLSYVAPVLFVTHLDKSIAYYRDRLGFELEFQYEGFYAGIVRNGCRVHLKCSPTSHRDQAESEATEDIAACFGVVGIESFAAHATGAGALIPVPLRQTPYGREFYVRDPDGYVLGFVEATPASEG